MSGLICCPLCAGNPLCPACGGTGVAQCCNSRCASAADTFDPETGEFFCQPCRDEQIALQLDDAA